MTQIAAPAGALRAAGWYFTPLGWTVLLGALILAFLPFRLVLANLYDIWDVQPEYSHCILIPPIALFLIWRQRNLLAHVPFAGSGAGVALVILGFAMWYVAELSTIWVIGQYAFLAVLYGLVLSLVGPAVFRRILVPLLILVFAIPLPIFFLNSLSLQLQLLSSALGVAVIRLFGISVFLDGNVIDLGTYKLQVVEACSGLRYLFPLMTLAFIIAYFYRAPLWKRAVVFLASVPIAILMNSLRIGLIGITVEYWGTRMAEGLLHDFEGWVVFMISMVVLLGIAVPLARVGNPGVRLRDVLLLDAGRAIERSGIPQRRPLPITFLIATALIAALAIVGMSMPERVEVRPHRASFAEFPMQLDGYTGTRLTMQQEYLDQLHVDDWLYASFLPQSGDPVGLWIAYYGSQRKGQSAHSPRSCLPGGGWEFGEFGTRSIATSQGTVAVNRALITHGSERALMYYWFQQRGRTITNEYLVKWYIFADALTVNRTDGGLVRLIVPIAVNGSEADADRELAGFVQSLHPRLGAYMPD